jgi:REP element-mobilizing transposase RayT
MAKGRKRHVQQALFDVRGRATVKNGKTDARRAGGKRRMRKPGSRKPGRPPKGERAGSPHIARPELKRGVAIHVVLRVVEDVGSLRKRFMYRALRQATIAVGLRELHMKEDGAFRIVHLSIQRNHVHLLVEADNKRALSRGMQSFQISAAKHLNREVSVKSVRVGTAAYKRAMKTRRRGSVFPDRFHEEIISTPRQARHALAYVLNNWRKHREDRDGLASTWKVDPYSTGIRFEGWKERSDALFYMSYRDTYEPMFTYLPKTWLLREGWRRAGPLISFYEVPGPK